MQEGRTTSLLKWCGLCLYTGSVFKYLFESRNDLIDRRHVELFQRRREGNCGNIRSSYSQDWSVQAIEGLFSDDRGNLRTNAERAMVFLHDNYAVIFCNRVQNRVLVQWIKRAQVYDFD